MKQDKNRAGTPPPPFGGLTFDEWMEAQEYAPERRGRVLRAGDRVEFDVFAGVDGPAYALNVRRLKGNQGAGSL